MAVTRIAAHPLVVAVALGLLAPEALANSEESPQERSHTALVDVGGATVPVRDIDPEEFARVEEAWYEARGLVQS